MSSVPRRETLSCVCELSVGGFPWALPGGTGAGGYSWWVCWGSRELGLKAGDCPVPCAACPPSPHTQCNARGTLAQRHGDHGNSLDFAPCPAGGGGGRHCSASQQLLFKFFSWLEGGLWIQGRDFCPPLEKEERGKGSNETFLSANLTTV